VSGGHVDAELLQRSYRAGGEPVAAHLVAPVRALLEDGDLQAGAGGDDGGCRSARSAADDRQVALLHGASLPAIVTDQAIEQRDRSLS